MSGSINGAGVGTADSTYVSDAGGAHVLYAFTLPDGVALVRTPSATLLGTGNATYDTGADIDGAPYAYAGATVHLAYAGTVPAGYTLTYSVSAGTLDGDSLTMPAADVTVTAILIPPPYPAYLDEADNNVIDNYDEWAARYGYDALGVNETAFLLDVAPGAVTNGVTPLRVVELGSTNVLVAGSVYEMLLQEYRIDYDEDYLPCRRIAYSHDRRAAAQPPRQRAFPLGGHRAVHGHRPRYDSDLLPHDSVGGVKAARPYGEPSSWRRFKITICDWNGDGKSDLIMNGQEPV